MPFITFVSTVIFVIYIYVYVILCQLNLISIAPRTLTSFNAIFNDLISLKIFFINNHVFFQKTLLSRIFLRTYVITSFSDFFFHFPPIYVWFKASLNSAVCVAFYFCLDYSWTNAVRTASHCCPAFTDLWARSPYFATGITSMQHSRLGSFDNVLKVWEHFISL